MKTLPDWSAKRVLLLGFGAEGRASLQYAAKCRAREIAIADQAEGLSLSATEASLVSHSFFGANWLANISEYDIIIRSPGVPLRHLQYPHRVASHTLITSSTQIFLEHRRDATIGITGTKGKSTTSSLIHSFLKNASRDAKLGGNIGLPALGLLTEPAEFYVLELSSYQLADVHESPHVAVLLNLYPEHLDHHGDFQRYGEAKANIARFQRPGDLLVLPAETQLLQELTANSSAQRVLWGTPSDRSWIEHGHFFYRCPQGRSHKICNVDTSLLRGPGNQRNILAALAAVSHLSIPNEALVNTIATFRPLPHRLEEVGVVNGVTYINDSISTVPEAAINALETFGSNVKTMLLGGYDRGVSFTKLIDHVMHTNVQTFIVFPPSGTRIAAGLREHPLFSDSKHEVIEVRTMEAAVLHAARCTPPSSICLMSPASPSFPLFKNFEERGAAFRAYVAKLPGDSANG